MVLTMPHDKTVYMLIGAPGSGKSTLARQLLPSDTPYVLISSDGIRAEINGDESSQENPEKVWGTFYRRLSDALLNPEVESIILDATFYDRRSRKTAFDYIGGRAVVHGLVRNPPLREVLRRNASRGRIVPESVVTRMFLALNKQMPEYSEGFSTIVNIDGDVNTQMSNEET